MDQASFISHLSLSLLTTHSLSCAHTPPHLENCSPFPHPEVSSTLGVSFSFDHRAQVGIVTQGTSSLMVSQPWHRCHCPLMTLLWGLHSHSRKLCCVSGLFPVHVSTPLPFPITKIKKCFLTLTNITRGGNYESSWMLCDAIPGEA